MANPEHVEILKSGVKKWNKWRKNNSVVRIDLSRADLSGTKLQGANLSGANLFRVDLYGADLYGADLSGAMLSGALLAAANLHQAILHQAELNGANLHQTILSRADLSKAGLTVTNLSGADLSGADLSGADLSGAIVSRTKLEKTTFSKSQLGSTIFGLTSLQTCKGLDSVRIQGKCVIDFETLKSSPEIPKSFLHKIGLPENYIDYLPEFYDEFPIRLFPVFLSHSSKDNHFTSKLYESLIKKGVQVWWDEKKIKPGDDIMESIDKGIKLYDKTVLICSKSSLNSWWVEEELDRILNKERKHQKQTNTKEKLLIPVTIDDTIFSWDGARTESILKRNVGDFRDWQNQAMYERAFNKLIEALNPYRDDGPEYSLLKS